MSRIRKTLQATAGLPLGREISDIGKEIGAEGCLWVRVPVHTWDQINPQPPIKSQATVHMLVDAVVLGVETEGHWVLLVTRLAQA